MFKKSFALLLLAGGASAAQAQVFSTGATANQDRVAVSLNTAVGTPSL